uniref:Uncharacterized protein n=1 Tax=Macrostomum lignano TaxID=282301 RepID=A0A1I8J6G8_9PLAT
MGVNYTGSTGLGLRRRRVLLGH